MERTGSQIACLPDALQCSNVVEVPEVLLIWCMAQFQANIPVHQLFCTNMVLPTWHCTVSCKCIFTEKGLEKQLWQKNFSNRKAPAVFSYVLFSQNSTAHFLLISVVHGQIAGVQMIQRKTTNISEICSYMNYKSCFIHHSQFWLIN